MINNGAALSTTPANGTTTTAVNSGANLQTTAQIEAVYACTTYPTAGTISLDYVPGLGVGLLAPLPTGANTIGAVTQASGPWTSNVTQFGGTNLSTGTGAGGAGIPRVTVSNDSAVNQAGTWTVQPGNTQNTTAWLTQDAANGTVAAGAAAGKAELIGCQFNTTLPTLTNTQQAAAQCDSKGQQLFNLNSWFASTAPTVGSKTSANSIPVVVASDQSSFPVAATLSAETTKVVGTVRVQGNVGGVVDAATGAAVPANAFQLAGRDSTQTGGGVAVPVYCDKSVAINVSASGFTELVAAVASKNIYVCGYNFIANGTVNVKFAKGTKTTTACDTTEADITGAYNLIAQTGISYGNGAGRLFDTSSVSASELCINLSAAIQVSGVVTYAQF